MNTNGVLQSITMACTAMAVVFGWQAFDHSRSASDRRIVEGVYVETPRLRALRTYPGIQVGEHKYFCRRHVCRIMEEHDFSNKPAIGVLDGSGRLIELRVGSEWAVHPRSIEIEFESALWGAGICASIGALCMGALALRSRRRTVSDP
jgi:hypothetical protein